MTQKDLCCQISHLTPAQALNLATLNDEPKTAYENHLRTRVKKAALENISSILITAGLRPEFRTEVLKKNLITILAIRDVAMKCEDLILEMGKARAHQFLRSQKKMLTPLVFTTIAEEDPAVKATITEDTVVTIAEAITEGARTTKCPAKTTHPPLEEETTLKEEVDKTEEEEAEITPKEEEGKIPTFS